MQLESDDFKDGDYLATTHVLSADFGFGCSGANQSPHLRWTDPPAQTRSLLLTLFDPDAPTGSGFWHWIVANMPPEARVLPRNASAGAKLPAGAIEVRTDFGKPGYGGPCPPPKAHPHRYLFTIWALAEMLPLQPNVTAAVVGFMANQHKLEQASLMGLYRRS